MVEEIERRVLLALTVTVNTTADENVHPGDSTVSLREAIELVDGTLLVSSLSAGEQAQVQNTSGTIDQILFSIPNSDSGFDPTTNTWKIQPTGALPQISNAVIIDGYSQAGAFPNRDPSNPNPPTSAIANNAVLTIELDGSLLPRVPDGASGVDGLFIAPVSGSNTDNSKITGLSIHSFSNSAIEVQDSNSVTIVGNFIGLGPAGEFPPSGGAKNNTEGNANSGVAIFNGKGNAVGGPNAADQNIISGNGLDGIEFVTSDTGLIVNNYIGIQRDGMSALSNARDGVGMFGATNAIILGNVVSGNLAYGIAMFPTGGTAPSSNIVTGNKIGPDASGNAAILRGPNASLIPGNLLGGVYIFDGNKNTVGLGLDNPTADQAKTSQNTISGNGSFGVRVDSTAGVDGVQNVIRGNNIGISLNHLAAIPNLGDGILLAGALHTTIGGSFAFARNVISGNTTAGIHIIGTATGGTTITTTDNLIQGNYVGVSYDPNSSTFNTAGNQPDIVFAVPNQGDGILIEGAAGTTLGGMNANAGNVVSGNGGTGIHLTARTPAGVVADPATTSASPNLIFGDTIGLGFSTQPNPGLTTLHPIVRYALPNKGDGILIEGLSNTQIGSPVNVPANATGGGNDNVATNSGGENDIAGNGGSGIHLTVLYPPNTAGGTLTPIIPTGTLIRNNTIGLGSAFFRNDQGNLVISTFTSLPNRSDGILLEGAASTTIGDAQFANVISANNGSGIHIIGFTLPPGSAKDPTALPTITAFNNTIQNNDIGLGLLVTNPDPTQAPSFFQSAFGNKGDGILIDDAMNTLVGSTNPALRNVISGNFGAGVHIIGSPTLGLLSNVVAGNFIGTDTSGSKLLFTNIDVFHLGNTDFTTSFASNLGAGVLIEASASGNTVSGNVIAGNASAGVSIIGGGTSKTSYNLIRGNFIGTDSVGTLGLGNTGDGIYVQDASSNTIDGQNVIALNGGNGIELYGGSTFNTISGNLIGVAKGAAAGQFLARGNAFTGVYINGATSNFIVNDTISANGTFGVQIFGKGAFNVLTNDLIGTDPTGNQPLGTEKFGNVLDGVFINSASNNLIGTDGKTPVTVDTANVIANNGRDGLTISGGATATKNLVAGNLIGTNRNNSTNIGNKRNGIFIDDANANQIGSPNIKILLNGVPTASNVVSGNGVAGQEGAGLEIADGASGTLVFGNFFGTTIDGGSPLANTSVDVFVNNSPNTMIGAPVAGFGNVISGQDFAPPSATQFIGIQLFGGQASGNTIQGNLIGTDATGTRALGTAIGVFINNAPGNSITSNTISGNDIANVLVFGNGASNNIVAANIIGLSSKGNTPLIKTSNPQADSSDSQDLNDPRSTVGVEIDQAFHTTVLGNNIAGNRVGIEINGNATLLQGGGTSATVPLASGQDNADALTTDFPWVAQEIAAGVPLSDFVGAFTVVKSNVLGIFFSTDPGTFVKTSGGDTRSLLTNDVGIFLLNSHLNLVGTPGAGNLVIHSVQTGIQIVGPDTSNPAVNTQSFQGAVIHVDNTVESNILLDDVTGVFIQDASNNVIGGANASNTIARFQANIAQTGVYIFGQNARSNIVKDNVIQRMGAYGILFFNTVPNSNTQVSDGADRNLITGSVIANFRDFNGPVTTGTTTGTTKVKRTARRTAIASVHPSGPQSFGNRRATQP